MSEQELNKIIASRISYYLEKTGKTQQQLADYMNVSQAAVSAWCLGQKMPRMNKIDQICQFFNCKRSDLMEIKSEKIDDIVDLIELLRHDERFRKLVIKLSTLNPDKLDGLIKLMDITID